MIKFMQLKRIAFLFLVSSTAAYAGYDLQPNEQAILSNLLAEDSRVFSQGGDSLIGSGFVNISADEAAKEYEKNQVAADQKYFRKKVILTAVIESINSGIGNAPYLSLKSSGNPFMRPQAHLRKNDIDKIVNLRKGNKIVLVCEGAGSIAGTAMFRNCFFADEVSNNRVEEIKEDIHRFLNGDKAKLDVTPQLVFFSIALARLLPINSPCFKAYGKACENDMKSAEKNVQSVLPQVASEMKIKGLTFTIKSR